MVGPYKAEAPCVTVDLVLNKDHYFTETVRTKAGETRRLNGHWRFDKTYNDIEFKPFLNFLEDNRGYQISRFVSGIEALPKGIVMGPIIVKCPDSSHEIDFVK